MSLSFTHSQKKTYYTLDYSDPSTGTKFLISNFTVAMLGIQQLQGPEMKRVQLSFLKSASDKACYWT